jgi:PAS domain S-box-containing protein
MLDAFSDLGLSSLDPGLIALLGVVFLAIVASLVSALVVSRRRLRHDVRLIVQSLEELRSGRTPQRCEVGPGSRLAVVADAANRLAQDLQARRTEADGAAARASALADATREAAVVTTDADGDVQSFSPGAGTLFGWEEEEVVSRPAAMLFEENAYKDLLPKLSRRSLRKQGVTARVRLVRRDGTTFPGEVAVHMLAAPGGPGAGFLMVVRDVTEQVRLEGELRRSEERMRKLVEGLGDGVIIVSRGRIAHANPAAEALLGGGGERRLVGTPWRDRVVARDLLVVEEALAEVEEGRAAERELRCVLAGATPAERVAVRIKATPVEQEGQTAALLVVHDESAERRVAEELARNEARLDAVLEATGDGVLVLAEPASGELVQLANHAVERLLGVELHEVLGTDRAGLLRLLRARGGGAEEIGLAILAETPLRSASVVGPDDVEREIEVRVEPLAGRGGEPLGKLAILHDRTDQRRAEDHLQAEAEKLQLSKLELERSYEQLREVNEALAARGEQLDRLNQELRRLDEMKSSLLGNVSHELQTPLVSIRGYTEMILKERLGPITEEQRKGLGLALKNVDRLITMIDNLLAFARTDPARVRLELAEFELKPLVDEAAELLRERMTARGIEYDLRMEDDALRVAADRDKLLQVLLNLLSNAVKFNRQGGRIAVSVRAGRAGYATVEVRDTGIGIAREEQGRIFERHFRSGEAGGRESGSGLGLAIVRDLLRLHGCTIDVESEEGRGATFTFTVPLAAADGAGRGAKPVATSEPAGAPPEGHRPATTPPAPPASEARPRLRIIRRPHGRREPAS